MSYKHFKSRIYYERNKEQVVDGFVKIAERDFGKGNVYKEKIQEYKNGKVLPDYYFRVKESEDKIRNWTLIILTNLHGQFLNDQVFVKAPVIWTLKNKKELYPNPHLVASVEDKFWLIPVYSFWRNKTTFRDYGDNEREGFLIDLDDKKPIEYIEKLDFWK